MKKFLSLFLTVLMLFAFVIPAFAAGGDGTENTPYLVSTVQDVMSIKDDLTACYKLTADIDMSSVSDFYPIGNSTDGAFEGVIDGNGKTIKNLIINTPNDKYTGLVGYSEGTVKNLTLENVNINGGRFTGGVVGYNSTDCIVSNCSVSGEIKSNYVSVVSVNIGGVIGYNAGIALSLTNSADVTVNPSEKSYSDICVGGVIGSNCSTSELTDLTNSGNISVKTSSEIYYEYRYGTENGYEVSNISGGIIGFSSAAVNLKDCINEGAISSKGNQSRNYAGGILGCGNGTDSTIENCENNGMVSSTITSYSNYNSSSWGVSVDGYAYSGGIAGYFDYVKVLNCINNAEISSTGTGSYGFDNWANPYRYEYFSGGIIGYSYGGNFENCSNYGNIKSKYYSGGICGYSGNDFRNVVNTGNVYNDSNRYGGVGGITGAGSGTFYNIYQSGDVFGTSVRNICGIGNGSEFENIVMTGNVYGDYAAQNAVYYNTDNSPNINNIICLCNVNSYAFADDVNINLATEFDYNYDSNQNKNNLSDKWVINSNISNGLPYLSYAVRYPTMNKTVKSLVKGETLTLSAWQNGTKLSNLKWTSSDDSIVSVSQNGYVSALSSGKATVSACTPDGYKAKCIVNVVSSPETFFEINDIVVNRERSTSDIQVISSDSDEEITRIVVDNPDVAKVSIVSISSNKKYFRVTGLSDGHTACTVYTTLGKAQTFNITVTNFANKLTLPSTVTVGREKQTKLEVVSTPDGNISGLTWFSSNESIASVDQNGIVTGVKIGETTISVVSDNGLVASCNVTVNAPIKNLTMEKSQIILIRGDTAYVGVIKDPVDATTAVSFRTSNSSCVTVNSSTGYITAVKPGAATIEAYYGSVSAACAVIVLDEIVPTGISVNESVNLLAGKSQKLSYEILPANATKKNVIWSVDNPAVAEVSEDGTVTAKSAGAAVVTATTVSGSLEANCIIKVSELQANKNTSIVIEKDSKLIYGFDLSSKRLSDSVSITGDCYTLDFNSGDSLATGNEIYVKDNDKIIETYTVVIFGDVNGDGWFDGMDSTIVQCIAAGMFTEEKAGKAVYEAADCNRDGVINQDDVDLLIKCGLKEEEISQTGRISTPEDFTYEVDEWGLYITGLKNPEVTTLILPEEIDGHKVNYVAAGAFENNINIEHIIIPDYEYEIFWDAFRGCTGIKDVKIYGGWLYAYVFADCTNLKSVYIGENAALTEPGVFMNCTSLTKVELPDNMEWINEEFFSGCTSLSGITLPNSIEWIDLNLFEGCTALTSIALPDSVCGIWDGAFSGCSCLSTITIPANVTTIRCEAFDNCDMLKTVYYKGTEEQWNKISIEQGNECLTSANIVFNS